MSVDNVGIAFAVVIAAGAATGIGASAVFCKSVVKMASKKVLAGGLGFSGGVMLYVSFVEIFQKSVLDFSSVYPESGYTYATLCFFAGVMVMKMIDWAVHKMLGDTKVDFDHQDPKAGSNPRADHDSEHQKDGKTFAPSLKICAHNVQESIEMLEEQDKKMSSEGLSLKDVEMANQEAADVIPHNPKLIKMGLSTALAIGIHNFPEGLATFVATLDDPRVGASLAVAIAIHNIPEGLCVAVPIYYATGNRWKAFLWAMLSGVSEPLAALLGWAVLASVMGPAVFGALFGVVAGMMVVIVLHELLPTAHHYDPKDQVTTNSLLLGMAVMALSLCLFQI